MMSAGLCVCVCVWGVGGSSLVDGFEMPHACIINYLQTKVSRRGNKVITSEHFDRLSFVRSFVSHATLTCFPIFN